MPWEELEDTYAPQFSPTVGAPAKPVRLAFGALFIKQRLGLTGRADRPSRSERMPHYIQYYLALCWLFEQGTLRSIDDGSLSASGSQMRISSESMSS